MARQLLQIYENKASLTSTEAGKLLLTITDDILRDVANSMFSEPSLPRRCDNKEHMLFRKYVGGGICVAQKYKRLFSWIDPICSTCYSQNIVNTLNFIFNKYYDGRYRCEWRFARTARSKKKPQTPIRRKVDQVQLINDIKDLKAVPLSERLNNKS